MNLHQLRIFQAVARHLSYRRAAEELILSQPAVSMQVKALEKSVGQELFEQIGRRIYLTEAGRELSTYCTRIFALLDEAQQVLDDLKGLQRGALKVVATTTVGIYVVPRALGIFHRRHPSINVSLSVENWSAAHDLLTRNEVDLAVGGYVEDDHDLAFEPFMPNELVVIASPEHRLAGQSRIPLQELQSEVFLVREAGSGTRATMEGALRERGFIPRLGMELSRNGAIKQAVAADLGIAVLSRQACLYELASGALIALDVEGFPVLRHWCVVHLRDKHLSAAALAFKQFLLHYRHPDPFAAAAPGQRAFTGE
ncbi:MAG: LysR family transcriptional regulator [Chloroflexi bacterium]|nr:LysR family transcriptional regulator [Chloroflexota bacterium]